MYFHVPLSPTTRVTPQQQQVVASSEQQQQRSAECVSRSTQGTAEDSSRESGRDCPATTMTAAGVIPTTGGSDTVRPGAGRTTGPGNEDAATTATSGVDVAAAATAITTVVTGTVEASANNSSSYPGALGFALAPQPHLTTTVAPTPYSHLHTSSCCYNDHCYTNLTTTTPPPAAAQSAAAQSHNTNTFRVSAPTPSSVERGPPGAATAAATGGSSPIQCSVLCASTHGETPLLQLQGGVEAGGGLGKGTPDHIENVENYTKRKKHRGRKNRKKRKKKPKCLDIKVVSDTDSEILVSDIGAGKSFLIKGGVATLDLKQAKDSICDVATVDSNQNKPFSHALGNDGNECKQNDKTNNAFEKYVIVNKSKNKDSETLCCESNVDSILENNFISNDNVINLRCDEKLPENQIVTIDQLLEKNKCEQLTTKDSTKENVFLDDITKSVEIIQLKSESEDTLSADEFASVLSIDKYQVQDTPVISASDDSLDGNLIPIGVISDGMRLSHDSNSRSTEDRVIMSGCGPSGVSADGASSHNHVHGDNALGGEGEEEEPVAEPSHHHSDLVGELNQMEAAAANQISNVGNISQQTESSADIQGHVVSNSNVWADGSNSSSRCVSVGVDSPVPGVVVQALHDECTPTLSSRGGITRDSSNLLPTGPPPNASPGPVLDTISEEIDRGPILSPDVSVGSDQGRASGRSWSPATTGSSSAGNSPQVEQAPEPKLRARKTESLPTFSSYRWSIASPGYTSPHTIRYIDESDESVSSVWDRSPSPLSSHGQANVGVTWGSNSGHLGHGGMPNSSLADVTAFSCIDIPSEGGGGSVAALEETEDLRHTSISCVDISRAAAGALPPARQQPHSGTLASGEMQRPSQSLLNLNIQAPRRASLSGNISNPGALATSMPGRQMPLRRSASLNLGDAKENLENFKQRLLRKREQWRERRQSSKSLKDTLRKDSKEEKESTRVPDADPSQSNTPDSKLYRWFSLRKSVNYDVERRSNTIVGGERNSSSSYTPTSATPSSSTTSSTANGVTNSGRCMPLLLEEGDADGGVFSDKSGNGMLGMTFQRRHQPPALPPMPQGLTPEQIKRRHIVASIVHSENNYVATLQRLVNDYKKPLEESKPPILNSNKLSSLFHRLSEIQQCHTLFRIALAESVRQWDREEKIGDVFVASFSKAIVLDIYSDFINNFTRAMEVAKQESKKKTAFSDFLKMRQISSADRLSFFGLMVKPVQRFPQFILFLQDLLKHTPQGHHDRMSLQLALTQLESLAEMLNERKREAEQYQAFRDTLKHINTKFAVRGIQDENRYLLRQDDVILLEFNQNGLINKTKGRRLFLTNDLIICVSVVPKNSEDYNQNERLSLKWAYPVTDVEIQDASSSPTLSRLLAAGLNKSGSLNAGRIPEETFGPNVDSLCHEMNDLMHDYEVVSRISALVTTLRGSYEGLSRENVSLVGGNIQRAIHIRDEQMAWVDACCLQFIVKTKDGREKETITFQTDNPVIKKDWIIELRLAQLALDPSNSPAFDVPEQERRPSTKMPLFVKALPVFSSKHQTEVSCGCSYTVTMTRPSRTSGIGRHQTFLWLCSSDGVSSHITIYLMQQVGLRELVRVDLVEVCITSLQSVPGITLSADESSLRAHTVWCGTHSQRLVVYSGIEPEKQLELGATSVPAVITTIKYHCDQVYVGLRNGCVQVYRRGADGAWMLNDPYSITLGSNPVTSLLPINTHVYAACADQVHVIDCFTAVVTKQFSVHHEEAGGVEMMAHSGIGLWIAQHNTATICLYHTETFRHLQDINVASNVKRVLSEQQGPVPSHIYVTALLASRGLLWVGTNVGVALTIPLPRLEGVPIISGRANISYHAHNGPITFLLTLQPHVRTQTSLPEFRQSARASLQPNTIQQQQQQQQQQASSESSRSQSGSGEDLRSRLEKQQSDGSLVLTSKLEKQQSDGSLILSRGRAPARLRQQLSSPVILRRKPRDHQQHVRRLSKTLPRGLGLGALANSQECDVYGLYGDLLNVHDYEDDQLAPCEGLLLSRYDSMRRSDPDLAVSNQVSTLDRRVRLKASRPRSLDLSSWSIDSRASSAYTTSSGSCSEDGSIMTSTSILSSNNGGPPPSNGSSGAHITTGTSRANTQGRRKENDQSHTLMTLTGGRGYVNLGNTSSHSNNSNNDAHVIVWEMKL